MRFFSWVLIAGWGLVGCAEADSIGDSFGGSGASGGSGATSGNGATGGSDSNGATGGVGATGAMGGTAGVGASGGTGGVGAGGTGGVGAGGTGGVGAGGSGATGGTGATGATGGSGAGGSGAGGSGATGGSGGSCQSPSGLGVCDTWVQCGCSAGQMCQIRSTDGTSACFPQGSAVPYGACSSSNDCGPGYDCVSGACQQYCDSRGDCGSSFDVCDDVGYDNGGVFTVIPGFRTCTRTCNPALPQSSSAPFQACGAGLGCIPTGDNSSMCYPGGTVGPFGSCNSQDDCRAGTLCIGNTCYVPCTNPNGLCPNGDFCDPLTYTGSGLPVTVANVPLGVCD